MKNAKNLQQINQKIADLKVLQKKLETDFVNDLSKQISKIIIKKNLFDIEKSKILECVENAFDDRDFHPSNAINSSIEPLARNRANKAMVFLKF